MERGSLCLQSMDYGEMRKKKNRGFRNIWCYRKLLKITWVDKMTKEKVLNFVKEKRSFYDSIKSCCDILIGHTIRYERLSGKILEGRERDVKGKGDKD